MQASHSDAVQGPASRGDRPFMEHVVRALAANNIRDLVVVVGYQKERIMDYFEDGLNYGVNIRYVEQGETLGTAHALSKVKPYLDGTFLAVNGDNLIDARSIGELISTEGDDVILAALQAHRILWSSDYKSGGRGEDRGETRQALRRHSQHGCLQVQP